MADGGEEITLRQGTPANLQSAWRILAGSAERMAAVLVGIAENDDVAPETRVRAAGTVLDRVGIAARPEVSVRLVPQEFERQSGTGEMVPDSVVVRRRLAELAAASRTEQEREAEIIEAELVEES